MGGSVSNASSNDELIDNLVQANFLRTPILQRVLRLVDRGNYCFPYETYNAYKDISWRRGNLHLSSPCVYSVVLENLQLRPGLSFLNIGSGTGYLSTIAGLVLGTYGVNHGVEVYSEAVEFAYDRLENFFKLSDAVDLHDFCEPTFTVGNALTLYTSLHQYDRVYCSAACSDEYELYIKNLVKVGGILVLALDGKLVKLVKNSETTWESEKVLSSAFDPLVTLPQDNKPLIYVKLDEPTPPTLQNICRSRIRSTLREVIHKEHPDIEIELSKKDKHPRGQGDVVIPFYDEVIPPARTSAAHSAESESQYTIESRMPRTMTIFLEDFLRRNAEVQLLWDIHTEHAERERLAFQNRNAANQNNAQPISPNEVLEAGGSEQTPQNETSIEKGSEQTPQNELSKVEGSEQTSQIMMPKVEGSQSTSQTEMSKVECSQPTSQTEVSKVEDSKQTSQNEMSKVEGSQPISQNEMLEAEGSEQTPQDSHEKQNLKRKRLSDNDSTSSSEPASESPKRMKSSSAALVTKKHVDVKDDQANADSHTDANTPVDANSHAEADSDVSSDDKISDLMAKKIGKLSLPKFVQRYVNYNRDTYFAGTNWWELMNIKRH